MDDPILGDDWELVGQELSVTPPAQLDETGREAWLDGFYTALALSHEMLADLAEAAVPADADIPDGPIEVAEDQSPPSPPCPDCGKATQVGMGGRYTCLDCGVTLSVTVEAHEDAQ